MTAPMHSPLPWRDSGVEILDATGKTAVVYNQGDKSTANRRIIVAAVNSHADLLTAAKQVLKEYDGGWKSGVDQMFYLRAAIEKVEQA